VGIMAETMAERLTAALSPTHLEIIDDSSAHAGHAGHDGSGESHFTVRIEAAAFSGISRLARQRLVYAALSELIAPDAIHALVIEAFAPGET